ncbi:kinase-like domain-containing protein [Cladorrhinum sp. PSN259]|nr:kinase-like domain-containing protein [Cladorrhinum sp. PSN259]
MASSGIVAGHTNEFGTHPQSLDATNVPRWKYNLIAVLACAQNKGFDFLSVAWQEPAGAIGCGAQSSVFQADASLKDRFAFKTSSPQNRRGGVNDYHEKIFRELLVQIIIHGHPELRTHPNIITLEAIGWDLQDARDLEPTVWPVLVLLVFEATLFNQIPCCPDAVHLDIKPDNLLVFLSTGGSRKYLVKLSDFGLSVIMSGGRKTKLRPATMWSAPENDDARTYSVDQVKRVYIYMFGMVCVWLLFGEQLDDLVNYETDEKVLERYRELVRQQGGQDDVTYALRRRRRELALMALKNAGSPAALQDFVARLIHTLSREHFSAMSFLQQALEQNPEHRLSSLTELSLSSHATPQSTQLSKTSVNTAGGLVIELSDDLVSLCSADFRVRRYIVGGLEAIFNNESASHELRTAAALQLGLCQAIGFGGAAVNDPASSASD